MSHFDLNLIKRLAYQRLQQIASNKKPTNHKNDNGIENTTPPNDTTTIKVENGADDHTKPPPASTSIISKLDMEKIVTESHKPMLITGENVNEIKPLENANNAITFNDYKPHMVKLEPGMGINIAPTCIRSRAALTPVTDILKGNQWYTDIQSIQNSSLSIPMRYRSLTIGTGPGNDVVLGLYGQCGRLSNKHAVIFYDDVTRYYELLNYSEFGSEVNGQMYSCDLTEFKSAVPATVPQSIIEANACAQKNAREIIDKRRGIVREMYELDGDAK